MRYIICSVGLTAAGKTTTMRKIADVCGIKLISEGSIKRGLVQGEYTITNSTDEKLRSRGYRLAIGEAFSVLTEENVIIDASFHQQFRRDWIYEEIERRKIDNISVIWVYCICRNEDIIRQRIYERFISPNKCADNQANTMDVYYYTKSTFDNVSISAFPSAVPTSIIVFDTEINRMVSTESNDGRDVLSMEIENWRKLWENYM